MLRPMTLSWVAVSATTQNLQLASSHEEAFLTNVEPWKYNKKPGIFKTVMLRSISDRINKHSLTVGHRTLIQLKCYSPTSPEWCLPITSPEDIFQCWIVLTAKSLVSSVRYASIRLKLTPLQVKYIKKKILVHSEATDVFTCSRQQNQVVADAGYKRVLLV